MVQYIVNPNSGYSETRWAVRIAKSKMQWIQPTAEQLASNDKVELHKEKVVIKSEYTIIQPDGKKVKVIPLNDYGLSKEIYLKALEEANK
jgi:hypothetical protein